MTNRREVIDLFIHSKESAILLAQKEGKSTVRSFYYAGLMAMPGAAVYALQQRVVSSPVRSLAVQNQACHVETKEMDPLDSHLLALYIL